MALTADQLTDFRGDIGDDGTVFTDTELNRFYTRASSDYNKAVVYALRQIMMNAAKLHDYRIAQSAESLSQVFDHIAKTVLPYWEQKVADAAQQIRIVGMRAVPPRNRDEPDT